MKIWVSGKQFVLPRQCACCGGYAFTHLAVFGNERNRLSRTKGWAWEVPYCLKCRQHVQQTERVWLLCYVIGAGSVLAGLLTSLWFGGWHLGVVLLVIGLGCDWVLGCCLLSYIRRRAPPNCTCLERSVHYLGSAGPCHSFDIRSVWYAKEFVRANHRKLVNVRPDVASLLRGMEFGLDQVPRRIIKSQH